MTWLDWGIFGIIALNLLHGFYLGFPRTMLSSVKYPVAFLLILLVGPQVGEFLTKPWNLLQNIALSVKDMIYLPAELYQEPIQISRLSELLSRGDFPVERFYTGMQSTIANLEIPYTLRSILGSFFHQERIQEYLIKTIPDLSGLQIENMADLIYFTLGSFLAKLIAISIGALVIVIIVACLGRVFLSFLHNVPAEDTKEITPIGSRFLGAAVKGVVCFCVLLILMELSTPLLCYFTIEPSQSLVFSVILDSTFHIRPWFERAVFMM